jgi:hypothetical protein
MKKYTEYILGGKGDFKPDSLFNKKQLMKGMKVEMEHTHNKSIAKEIAKDHLTEHPKYYVYLERMEKKLERMKR